MLIQGYLDKMYVYMERCKGDNVISIEEIEGFHKLMDEFQSEMNHLKMSASDNKYNRIEKEAQRLAQQDLKKELLLKYKERLKIKVRINVFCCLRLKTCEASSNPSIDPSAPPPYI